MKKTKLLRKFFSPVDEEEFENVFDNDMLMAYLFIAFRSVGYTQRTFPFRFDDIGHYLFDNDDSQLSRYQLSQLDSGLDKLCNKGYITITISQNNNRMITIGNKLWINKDDTGWFYVFGKDIDTIKESTNKWVFNARIYLTLLSTMYTNKYGSTPFETIGKWTSTEYRQIARSIELLETEKVIIVYKLNEVKEYNVQRQFISYRGKTKVKVPYMYSRVEDEESIRKNLFNYYKYCIDLYFDKLCETNYDDDNIINEDDSDIKLEVKHLVERYRNSNVNGEVTQRLKDLQVNVSQIAKKNIFNANANDDFNIDDFVDEWYTRIYKLAKSTTCG